MPKEFIMRGKTTIGESEVLNMSGYRPGYGYRLVEFQLFPSTAWDTDFEMAACISANGIALDPESHDFNEDGLIASIITKGAAATNYDVSNLTVINDLFVITQDLILTVFATAGGGSPNWQCRFKEIKLSSSAEAVANYKQYTIYNTSS